MGFTWPDGVERIPDEPWTRQPVKELALDYDTVEQHGWYENLDPTVAALDKALEDGDILVDYSGGTGILIERLLDALGDRPVGIINVDSSRKFLRLCLEKFDDEPRVACRLIDYLEEEGRLQLVEEVLEPALLDRGIDALVSTNAIHLYYDLPETLASWRRVLTPDGFVHVQSGNIRREGKPPRRWIIDETVHAIADEARTVVLTDDRFDAYRGALKDEERMAAHDELRSKYFLPVRSLDHYLATLEDAGFRIGSVDHQPVEAQVEEWLEFLSVYHAGILGWIGGTPKVEGAEPDEATVQDRLAVLEVATHRVFEHKETFMTEWTYITAEPA